MELKGWKGFLIGVVVVGAIILGVVVKMMPHSVSGGAWEIDPEHLAYTQVRASQQGHMQVEITPDGPVESYMACIIDDVNAPKLATEDLKTIPMIASQEATGAVTFKDVVVGAGSYDVVVINLGKNKIKMKYQITETKLH